MERRGKNLSKFRTVLELLVKGSPLPEKYKEHRLVGNFYGFLECHIEPDWLLIYERNKEEIILARTGTHSDLF